MLSGLWAIEECAGRTLAEFLAKITPEIMARASEPAEQDATNVPYTVEDGVATVALHGVMMKGGGWLQSLLGGTDTPTFTQAVSLASRDPKVKAILLDIDSPGGMVSGTSDAAEAVAMAAKIKPTHAYTGDACCSAAYWIASQAKSLHAGQTAMIGSIGVRTSLTDTSALAERLGVKVHPIGTGTHKTTGTEGAPVTDEQIAEVQRQVESMGALFQKAIATGRGLKAEKVAALADGRVWIGKEAIGKGLADGIASRESVRSALSGYIPGRKAVKIAAISVPHDESSQGDTTMTLWEQFKRALGGGDDGEDTAEQGEGSVPHGLGQGSGQVEPRTEKPGQEGKPDASALAAAALTHQSTLKSELEAQRAEIDRLLKAQADQAAAANQQACEALMRQGLFPAADLAKNVERRAQNPALFDALMAERPVSPLVRDAITGEQAIERVDPSVEASVLAECKAYFRKQYAIKGGNN